MHPAAGASPSGEQKSPPEASASGGFKQPLFSFSVVLEAGENMHHRSADNDAQGDGACLLQKLPGIAQELFVVTANQTAHHIVECSAGDQRDQNGNQQQILKSMREIFTSAKGFKPEACRSESFETYLIGLNKKG